MATKDIEIDTADVDTASKDNPDLFDSALSKKVVRKIDLWILPLLFVTYNFNFLDKTILSSASVFGLKDSTVSLLRPSTMQCTYNKCSTSKAINIPGVSL